MSEQTLSGFLPLSRKFFEHHFWTKKRVYSPAEAWLDLLAMACYEPEATMIVNNRTVKWKQGEVFASVRYLMKRWDWSNNRVQRFLDGIEEEKMIAREETPSGTIIRLQNYEKYNKTEDLEKHSKPSRKSVRTGLSVNVSESNGYTGGYTNEYTERNENGYSEVGTKRIQRKSSGSKNSTKKRDSEKTENGYTDGYSDGDTNGYKIKNLINKNTMTASASAAAYPPEFVAKYQHLKDWIATNAPRVGQMKEPITIEQAFKLRGTIDPKLLSDILTAMHNYEPLLKKNRSTYLTIKNWQRRREQSQPGITKPISTTPTALGSHDIRRIKKEEEDTLRLANGQL